MLAKSFDALLQRLSHKQLRILLKEAIDQGIDAAKSIRQYILLNHKAKEVPEDRLMGDPYGKGLAINPEEQSNVKKTTAAPTGPATGAPSGPAAPPAPPPAPAPPPPPTLTLNSTKFKKTAAKSDKKGGGGGDDLIQDLKNAVAKGGNLRHVELAESERAKRGENSNTFEVNLKKAKQLKEDVESGSDLYKIDPKGFVDKLQSTFLKNYDYMNICFSIIDNSEIEFSEAYKLVEDKTKVDKATLATSMLDVGFTLKYQFEEGTLIDLSGEETKDYIAILCPLDMPVYIIVKLIKAILRANAKNRHGGAITEEEQEMAEKTRVEQKQGKEVVQGYWKSKKKPEPERKPENVVSWSRKKKVDIELEGSLFDNDDDKDENNNDNSDNNTTTATSTSSETNTTTSKPIKGYGRRKEEIPQGSLWD
eukprot:TRINITY_DN6335_c0_g1_i2.p1 TRINITY_DN6335_c0_g1~~TRINITY_DN6335_c0_g1_i2.p1  ORF type:complete len:421 (+),score=162.16 TRINITY_DN6335_c0_g1_i2:78-1340(+)